MTAIAAIRGGRVAWGVMLVAAAMMALVATAAPAGAEEAGTGHFEGTEDEEQSEMQPGPPCFKMTKSSFALRGEGTYHGITGGGDRVVYEATVPEGEELYEAGPIELWFEATEEYYFGPDGTYGERRDDGTCDPATKGENAPIPARFELYANGIYAHSGGPCKGTGHFWRGTASSSETFHAEWAWDADCTVDGNTAEASGRGTAPQGTHHTFDGTHEGCFEPPCYQNLRGDYVQHLDAASSGDTADPGTSSDDTSGTTGDQTSTTTSDQTSTDTGDQAAATTDEAASDQTQATTSDPPDQQAQADVSHPRTGGGGPAWIGLFLMAAAAAAVRLGSARHRWLAPGRPDAGR